MARMLFPALLGVILLLLLVSLRQIEAENLLPLAGRDALPALRGALPVAEVLLLGLYAPGFLLGGLEKRPGAFRALAQALDQLGFARALAVMDEAWEFLDEAGLEIIQR